MTHYTTNNEYAVVNEYAGLASEYDRRWAFYIEATLRETLKRMDLTSHASLLDIGCGTGSLLQIISKNYPTVKIVGIDLSMEMLKIARDKQIKDAALIAGEARCLPFRSKSFDMVVSCNALHYLRNPEECLSEIARVLKPQGRIVITDWCDDYIACRVCDVFLRVFNRAHFKTYGRRACELLLRNAGYSNVQVERYKINWLWGLMTAKAQIPLHVQKRIVQV
ncbi:MAG: methyltransferase domain-containing protein [Candidatus Brocadia sp.]|nr:methyltransferase domain-containing protein [Candidatus Brocadia sp.]NUO07303.1 methyltransferase domain-containing protein [Candidatus Brocadia sp.]